MRKQPYYGEKSYVSIEQNQCLICLTIFDTNTILLNKRLTPKLNRTTLTGHGLCPECQKKIDDGYLAIVGVKNENNAPTPQAEDAIHTGEICFIKREVATHVFPGVRITADMPMMFCDPQVIEILKGMMENAG